MRSLFTCHNDVVFCLYKHMNLNFLISYNYYLKQFNNELSLKSFVIYIFNVSSADAVSGGNGMLLVLMLSNPFGVAVKCSCSYLHVLFIVQIFSFSCLFNATLCADLD